MGLYNKGEHSMKGGHGSFVVRCFYNSYENLIEMPKKKHFNFVGSEYITYDFAEIIIRRSN
jgi:hypothetical protein